MIGPRRIEFGIMGSYGILIYARRGVAGFTARSHFACRENEIISLPPVRPSVPPTTSIRSPGPPEESQRSQTAPPRPHQCWVMSVSPYSFQASSELLVRIGFRMKFDFFDPVADRNCALCGGGGPTHRERCVAILISPAFTPERGRWLRGEWAGCPPESLFFLKGR